ncbi:coiled-coil-helix-coiled-coil-helix domain-containing protein [Rhodotorula paludigena]|uniref:coiled-coil-helix-coiled-coil-helix domain-containing protein n=1 Tax=Rhodotorula paludigena TaxID=86838 RepID=UPI0031812C83
MLRASVRAVPRSVTPRGLPHFRTATTSSTQRRFAVYQSQTTKPYVYASLGLVALVGWSAAILTVGGKSGKRSKQAGHAKEENSKPPVPGSASGVSGSAAQAPVAEAAKEAADPADSSQAAAFNPETGEINWDCPCLGGMADGPCGEEFKQAFSCFVYSEAEPKGIDCVEKFRGMQDCFRKHPDIYGDEAEDLADGEEEDGFDLVQRAEAAIALPDEHFLEAAAAEAPTSKPSSAAAALE